MAADWSIAVGILVFLIGIVFAIVFYVRSKKYAPVLFVASVCTYIFAVFYTWDVYLESSKSGILGMLVMSTLLMFYLAHYFGQKPKAPHAPIRGK